MGILVTNNNTDCFWSKRNSVLLQTNSLWEQDAKSSLVEWTVNRSCNQTQPRPQRCYFLFHDGFALFQREFSRSVYIYLLCTLIKVSYFLYDVEITITRCQSKPSSADLQMTVCFLYAVCINMYRVKSRKWWKVIVFYENYSNAVTDNIQMSKVTTFLAFHTSFNELFFVFFVFLFHGCNKFTQHKKYFWCQISKIIKCEFLFWHLKSQTLKWCRYL